MGRHPSSILIVILALAALHAAPMAFAVTGDGISRPKPKYHQPGIVARRHTAAMSSFSAPGTRSGFTGDSDLYWAENNRMRLYFHTRYSDEWLFIWEGMEAETSYRENFALWFDGRTTYGSQYDWGDGDDGEVATVKLFGSARNDEDNSCILDFRNALRLERSIRIAPGDGTYFKICYKVTNITDQPIEDIRFFELVDFDIPWTGAHGDDIGWYDALTDFVWVKDEAWFQNGFTGNRPSSHHSVNQYYYVIFEDANDGVLDDNAESNYNDPGIGLQWDVGTLQPGQTWDLDVTFWFGQPNSLFAVAGPDRTVRVGETVRFDGGASYASQGTITTYDWDLDGDGDYGDASGVSVDHVFLTAGTRSVVLRVTDDTGNHAYDECRITVLPAMYQDVVVTAWIPLGGLDTDTDLATAPHSAAREDETLRISWQAGPMNVGMKKSFSYVTELLTPVAGERRMVEEDCVVEYLDATVEGGMLPLSFSLGPAFVDVISGFGIAISADKEEYLPPETVKLTTSVAVPAFTAVEEFAGRERLLDAALFSVDADTVPGAAVVAAGAESAELSFIVEAPVPALWRNIRFDASCPEGASVAIRTRSAATKRGLAGATFTELADTPDAPILSRQGRFLEARVSLRPNTVGASPEFRSLSISYATDGYKAVLRLVSPSGQTLDLASHDISAADCGTTVVFTDRWPTSGAVSGEWQAVAELHGPIADGGTLATATDDFQILSDGLDTIVSCAISADRPRYCPGDTATLSPAVFNDSVRDVVSGLTATVAVSGPTGAELFRENYQVGSLPAASAGRRSFRLGIIAGMPLGLYTATLSVLADGSQVASSTTSFQVVAEAEEGRGLAGILSAMPQRVLRRSGTLLVNGVATNTGTSALASVELIIRLHSQDGEYISGVCRENTSLPTAASHTMTWEIEGIALPPGVYPASFTAELAAPSGRTVEIPLDCIGFEVVNLAPVADFGGPRTMEATSAHANPVTLSAASSTDANSTDPEGRDDIVSFAWTIDGEPAGMGMTKTVELALGSHEVTLAATDSCAAIGTTTAVIVLVDTVPPVISGLMPASGSYVKHLDCIGATLHDAVSGIAWGTIELRANATPINVVANPTDGCMSASLPPDVDDGWLSLTLVVHDRSGNISSAPEWRICLDRTPPVFALQTPLEDAIAAETGAGIAVRVSDALSGVVPESVTLHVDGTPLDASFDPDTGIASGTMPEGLTDGWHQISTAAVDVAGNQGQAVWTVGLDLTPPEFTQMVPGTEEPLASADQLLSVIVSDAWSGLSPESLRMTLDGEEVPALFDSATGRLSFSATGLTDGVHTVGAQASDLVGNTSAVTWQFSVSLAIPGSEYLLFHNSQTGRLDITGGGKTISGMVHSHADIRVRGNRAVITGATTAVGGISVRGSGHDIALQQPQAAPVPMPEYPYNYYESNADYIVEGGLTAGGGNTLQPGIWLVRGNVTITGDINATVTIVATGNIRVRGQVVRITNADSHYRVALYSRDGNISFAANGSEVVGIVYAPAGTCKIASNGSAFTGGVVGDTIDISGQNVTIGPLEP